MKTLSKLLIILGIISLSAISVAAPVNINTADASTLAANIKGVGEKKAQAIIHYRKTNGPFKRIDDIVKVKGIGAKLLEKNRADLRVNTPKTKKN
ncbi:MAG: helix-hairpin-helix domain-containing protein [Thioalkalispiraceae bacterium]|jgi:competence protein ComEA